MNGTVKTIEDLLLYAENELGLCAEDKAYARNQLYELFQVEPEECTPEVRPLEEMTDELVCYGIEHGIAEEGTELRFETRILGLVTPSPGEVVMKFDALKENRGAAAATDYLYNLSVKNNYIRINDIRRNICWYAEGKKGQIAVTINLSKPEKDPKQVLAEKAFKGKKYPKCLLCIENIGFCGTPVHPARQTLRIVPVTLNGEGWHMQYSPYVYYDEHCIVFRDKHVPMKITDLTFVRLLEFVEQYPDYFLGSNADLPIVGGSILAHDHYQGGKKVLPMFFTGLRKMYEVKNGVAVGVRDWYNSVVTVKGKDRNAVALKAAVIAAAWKDYTDESADVICATGEERHNTVTPVASFDGVEFTLDLILRNNRTDEKHPFGIFHPTEDMHNIKKESIGLIEAMGLFILPGRLKNELYELMKEMRKEKPDLERIFGDEKLSKHSVLIVQAMADKGTALGEEEARNAILDRVNDVCFRILECTAVFKNDERGEAAFDRFMSVVTDGEGIKGAPKKRGRPPLGKI